MSMHRQTCYDDFSLQMNREFNIYAPQRQDSKYRSLFTSYYSPDFYGSLRPSIKYKNPIYALPAKSYLSKTRVEIDFDKALKGMGLELVYVKEPLFDLYLFHIEGGGRVFIQNKVSCV